jgi:hypothetical protein
MKSPTPKQIKKARGALTQVEAAKLVGKSRRQWQAYEAGTSVMHWTTWECFKNRDEKERN